MKEIYTKWHEIFPNKGSGVGKKFPWLLEVIKQFNPKSILDFGCGKGGTADFIEEELKISVKKYDKGFPKYNILPTSVFDLVYSADVFEHIEFEDIENTLNERVDGVYKYESSEGSFVITISGILSIRIIELYALLSRIIQLLITADSKAFK